MRPCNTSDPNQRWTFASDRAISPSADSQLCLTRNAAAAATPLFVTKCRGSAGRLDPVQQWEYSPASRIITTGEGRGCLCSTENPAYQGQIHCRYPSCVDSAHPHITSNEIFSHDLDTGWIWSNCSGANCPNLADAPDNLERQQFCVTSMGDPVPGSAPAPAAAPTAAELAQHPARRPSDHPNCIPWSLDPFETRPGWYHDAGMDGMVLTANDTLISIHEA